MHYHLYQTEEFQVVSGTARFFVNDQSFIRKAGEIQFIPQGACHAFENVSTTGEYLVIDFRLDKQDWKTEECFFRDFFGYLDDCRKARQSPSPCQMSVFLYSLRAPLAVPVPGPVWLGRQVSWVVTVIMGLVIGQWLLGYRPSYDEYYHDKKKK